MGSWNEMVGECLQQMGFLEDVVHGTYGGGKVVRGRRAGVFATDCRLPIAQEMSRLYFDSCAGCRIYPVPTSDVQTPILFSRMRAGRVKPYEATSSLSIGILEQSEPRHRGTSAHAMNAGHVILPLTITAEGGM